MNRKKILLVEDNLVEQKVMATHLIANGYDVIVAADGAAAVSAARRDKPDLILLDILFPPDVAHGGGVSWDGFLILAWLRRLEEARNTPVIFISSVDPAKYKHRALAAGAHCYFHKPVNPCELLDVIARIFESQASPPVVNKRVLFVDDEIDWRFFAGTVLESAGFEVVTAKDAAEAMQRMESVKLDAIVLDVNLAGENGLLLMEFLKQKHPGVPILIYTGMDHDNDAIKEMLKQGARGYLKKGGMSDLSNTLKGMVN